LLQYPCIEVNAQDIDGCTAIIHAGAARHPECIEVLLKHPDIDTTIETYSGFTVARLLENLKSKRSKECYKLVTPRTCNCMHVVSSCIKSTYCTVGSYVMKTFQR